MWDRQLVDPLDLLLHPVRLRVVHVMSGDRTRTTTDLCAALPDIPKTTLYRHVSLLVEGKILEVADEQRVHGAVERHYRLRRERTLIDSEAAAGMSLDDHRRGFAAAMAALLAEFNAYLDRDGAAPAKDGVGYRQGILWADEEEFGELVGELMAALRSRAAAGPGPGRLPRIISMITFPAGKEAAPQEAAPQEAAPQEAAPQEAAPKEAASEELASKEIQPEETPPGELASAETVPE
jgi:DNA-binding transcriptional ArsR family regulator